MNKEEKCYCLEIFKKKNPEVRGTCLKMSCGRYRIEQRKQNKLVEENGK